jgi:PrgI family protein
MTTATDPSRVRIPADVDRDDRLLLGLTARQLAILLAAALPLWLAHTATTGLVPLPVFLAVAAVVMTAAGVLAVGRRDGVSLDRLLLAALHQAASPRVRVPAPDGVLPPPAWVRADAPRLPSPLVLPARAVRPDGVVDLGGDGHAVLAVCTPVSFALRTPAERQALVAGFARYLNSLTTPIQILVRAERVDLSTTIATLTDAAAALPHPALEAAARSHAAFLADLAARRDLQRRQLLLVLREPHTPGRTQPTDEDAARRVRRRAEDAARALAATGTAVTVLDGAEAVATLTSACQPLGPARPAGGLAAPDQVITARDRRR